jgi:hypothetical protein
MGDPISQPGRALPSRPVNGMKCQAYAALSCRAAILAYRRLPHRPLRHGARPTYSRLTTVVDMVVSPGSQRSPAPGARSFHPDWQSHPKPLPIVDDALERAVAWTAPLPIVHGQQRSGMNRFERCSCGKSLTDSPGSKTPHRRGHAVSSFDQKPSGWKPASLLLHRGSNHVRSPLLNSEVTYDRRPQARRQGCHRAGQGNGRSAGGRCQRTRGKRRLSVEPALNVASQISSVI